MKGSKEIGFTVLSMSTSLIAVFIPILLMGGIVGKLFREFAVTLSVAIAVSLVVSLTTTPMLCAQFLEVAGREPARAHLSRQRGGLQLAARRVRGGIAVGAAPPGADPHGGRRLRVAEHIPLHQGAQRLFPAAGHGTAGRADNGRAGHFVPAMREKQRQLAQMVLADPAVLSVTAFAGGGGPGGGRTTRVHVYRDEAVGGPAGTRLLRRRVNRLRSKLSSVPGATLYLQTQQDIQIGGRGGAAQYQYTLSDENLKELNTWSPKMLRECGDCRNCGT